MSDKNKDDRGIFECNVCKKEFDIPVEWLFDPDKIEKFADDHFKVEHGIELIGHELRTVN